MSKQAIKRIINRDIKDIQELELNKQGIYIEFNEENMLEAQAMIIGPKDTPYQHGFLFFDIIFPTNYPWAPPIVYYISTSRLRIHPNLYVGRSSNNFRGKVCLSILNTWTGPKWTTVMTISSVLLSIQSLLISNPITNEPGFEKCENKLSTMYNHIVQYDTFSTLIYTNRNIPIYKFKIFKPIIDSYLEDNLQEIKQLLNTLYEKNPKSINIIIGVYRINGKISYKNLLNLI